MQLKTQLKYTAAIVAAALSMSTISLANAASVSISNPGFESSFDNWEDTEPSAISSDEYTGSKAAKITGSSGKFQQDITVDTNTDYQLTAYISGHGKIGATIDDTSYTSSSSGNDDYELVTLSFNSGSETSVTIFGSYNGDEGRFDDFALESTGTSTSSGTSSNSDELEIDNAFDDGTSHSNYPPENAIDESTAWTSRWAAEAGGDAVNLTMQLKENSDVTKVGIAWGQGESRTHTFEIYARSGTSGSWTKVFDDVSSGSSTDLEVYDVTDISAQQIRVKAQQNSAGSDWMNITEVKIYGGDAVESEETEEEVTEEEVVSTGSCNIDMSIWGYTTGDGTSMNDVDDIQDLVDNKTLGSNGEEEIIFNNGCVTFTVANDAASSGGSTYPRSELRELMARYTDGGDANVKGITKNNWVTSEASSSNQSDAGGVDGNLKATLIVNTVSVDATSEDQIGRIIVGQIHGEDHEPVKIYYRKLPEHDKGSVFFTVDDSSGDPGDRINIIGFTDKNDTDEDASGDPVEPSNGIALGDEWSYEIDLSGDQLQVTVWHDGYTYTTEDSITYTKTRSKQLIRNSSDTSAITIDDFYASDYMYFKAGLYNQNKTGTDSPDYASVTFKVIDVDH